MSETALIDKLLSNYLKLPDKERAELDKLIDDRSANLLWIPTVGPQLDAVNCLADVLLYGGEGGGGKGLSPNTPIVTPFGFRKIGDLKVGDSICSVDGGPTKVIGVYPQPKQAVYRVTFIDDSELITDGPHRWLYSVAGKRKWPKSGLRRKIGTTEQLMVLLEKGLRPLIPMPKPLKFTRSYKYNMRVIDPYLLGVLLGDGSVRGKVARITTADPEIIERCDIWPNDLSQDDEVNYRIIGKTLVLLKKELSRLGINDKLAHEKVVPKAYLWAPVADRWSLLQGLMDTDGTASKDNHCAVSFCSTSEQLAKDVCFLVRSLGGYARITSKIPTINGEPYRRAYNVYIRLPDPKQAFSLERKRKLCQKPQTTTRRIANIEPCGEQETVCIAVDHPSSLYVAGEALAVTHNTDLGIGIAFECHRKSLLIRKQYTDLTGLTDRAKEINGTDKGYNGSSPPRLKTVNDKTIDFAGVDKPGDEDHWQGRPHDLLYIDEAVQLREKAARFLMGWVRSTIEGQRCRTIFGSNPPIDSGGDWIIKMFAPWLDTNYANPAAHGELRWVVTLIDDAGNSFDHWVDGPDAKIASGRTREDGSPIYLIPESRTFISAHLSDNPFLAADGKYAAKLDAMQEPLRSAVRDGNFMAARQDHDEQLIPSAWVWAAHNRWTAEIPRGIPMCAIGVDAARSKDETVLAPRYDGYYTELIAKPGIETPHGRDVAALVLKHRKHGAMPVIDCGEMNGAEAYAHLEENGVQCYRHVGVDPSIGRSKTKHLKFFNKRAEVYWRFMEALDPEQDGGCPIALPDDAMLRSDLTAPKWELTANGIKITPKKELVKTLGRSPDRGDAVVMSWAAGQKAITDLNEWRQDQRGGTLGRKRPAVNMGPRRGHRRH